MSTCGHCGRSWDEAKTPTPAGRCPFEYEHVYEEDEVLVLIVPEHDAHTLVMIAAYPPKPGGGSSITN